MNEEEAATSFYQLLYSHTIQNVARIKDGGLKLAHYTSAANALNIISGRELWLRNAALMNDFAEIGYGVNCIVAAFETKAAEMKAALDTPHPNLAEEVLDWLARAEHEARHHTYLSSFAEHAPDDRLGKLSMWRAYGGATAGVALVLNITALESDSEALNVFAHPVTYGYDNFVSQLDTILTSLLMNQDLLANLPRERVKAILFYALRDLILTTKHQGFAEEEEWRIIHSPYTFPSDFMRRGTHAIGDLPQNIYKLTLADQPGLNMPELELDTLIHRVVIGPCLYPEQVAHALFHALEERGITNPRDRITVSDIPLRQRI